MPVAPQEMAPRVTYSKVMAESYVEDSKTTESKNVIINFFAVLMTELNKYMQKACLELKNISSQTKAMRKKMEEDERVLEEKISKNDGKCISGRASCQ